MNFKCNLCNISFQSDILYQAHLYSASHETNVKNIQKRGANVVLSDECKCSSYFQKDGYGYVTCTLCRIPLNSYEQARTHVLGQKHRKLLPGSCRSAGSACSDKVIAALKKIPHTVPVLNIELPSSYDECKCSTYIQKAENGYVTCTLCRVSLNSSGQVYTHVMGEKHRKLLPLSCRSSWEICTDKAVAACKNIPHTVQVSNIQPQSSCVECECSTYIQKLKDGFLCTLCRVPLNSYGQVRMHVMGQKHLKLLPCKCPYDKALAACENISNAAHVSNTESSDRVKLLPITPSYDEPDYKKIMSKVKFFNVNDEVCF